MNGKNVRIFLIDGSSSGLLTAEVVNWTGQILSFPRSRLAEGLNRDESSRTGVYLLVGDDPDDSLKKRVYVGEGDSVRKRIASHAKDNTKEFWTKAYILSSKDKNLTKAHVRYLESQLIKRLISAGRVVIANSTQPSSNDMLPEADMVDMEYNLEQLSIILPLLSLNILKPRPVSKPVARTDADFESMSEFAGDQLILAAKKHGYQAFGYESGGELTVGKGSTAAGHPDHKTNSYSSLRKSLISSGVLEKDPTNDSLYRFVEDFTFSSPSAAASVIHGRNSNGRTDWSYRQTGKTLKEMQDAQFKVVKDDGIL